MYHCFRGGNDYESWPCFLIPLTITAARPGGDTQHVMLIHLQNIIYKEKKKNPALLYIKYSLKNQHKPNESNSSILSNSWSIIASLKYKSSHLCPAHSTQTNKNIHSTILTNVFETNVYELRSNLYQMLRCNNSKCRIVSLTPMAFFVHSPHPLLQDRLYQGGGVNEWVCSRRPALASTIDIVNSGFPLRMALKYIL